MHWVTYCGEMFHSLLQDLMDESQQMTAEKSKGNHWASKLAAKQVGLFPIYTKKDDLDFDLSFFVNEVKIIDSTRLCYFGTVNWLIQHLYLKYSTTVLGRNGYQGEDVEEDNSKKTLNRSEEYNTRCLMNGWKVDELVQLKYYS